MSVSRIVLAAAAAAFALASPARAEYVIDLTKPNTAPVTYNNAIFAQSAQQPTGTGVFQPFVRIQGSPTEAGYNTDARPVQFDTKDENQWTHSLLLGSLVPVTINGKSYYQFALDVNEQGNQSGRLLSMDDFRVYLGNSGSLTNWNDGFGSNSVKVYDLDSAGGARVDLDYKLNHGSGSGDMYVYVPTSVFDAYGKQFPYVYLYSSFGTPYASDAGFEEWSAKSTTPQVPQPPPTVPAPPAALLGALAVPLLGLSRRRLLG